MGTRNLTMVVVNKETKIAQYGQYDGYPGGQGVIALRFARERLANAPGRDLFLERLHGVRFASPGEEQDGSGQHPLKQFHRNTAAEILEYVWKHLEEGAPILLVDSSEFASDSLFCEWAYVVDLDTNTFEVFKGFNKEPLSATDRFKPLERKLKSDSEYYPVRLIRKWSLDDLPSEERFVEELIEKDEDDL